MIRQKSPGMKQPIRVMVVTRQSTASDHCCVTTTGRPPSQDTPRLKESWDEHKDQNGPCEHANLPEAEQIKGWYANGDNHQPREDPRRGRIRTNGTSSASRQLQSIIRRRDQLRVQLALIQLYSLRVQCLWSPTHPPCFSYAVRCCSAAGNRHPTVGVRRSFPPPCRTCAQACRGESRSSRNSCSCVGRY